MPDTQSVPQCLCVFSSDKKRERSPEKQAMFILGLKCDNVKGRERKKQLERRFINKILEAKNVIEKIKSKSMT